VQELIGLAENALLRRSIPSLRKVINATGIVLHTGLGRAPLSASAIEAIAEGASGYCNLEYNLESGGRGHRADHVLRLLTALTGAESATVVNNNAAATFLILRTLAAGREVIVSRGQLVEIGGSFRLPMIMAESGAILREVGTTNRTRLSDYEKTIGERTAVILRVHPSNYRVVGFSESVETAALAKLAHERGLVMVDDLGSGALVDLGALGLPQEPRIGESVKAGADIVCFSGDKLLGGPQCGVIVGRRSLIERLEAHPLMRTYRVDKLTLLALEATLRTYEESSEPAADIPLLAMLTASPKQLNQRAEALLVQLRANVPGEEFRIASDVGFAGGGSLPAEELPTVVIEWRPKAASVEAAVRALRNGETPVVARVRENCVCFDLRTIAQADFDLLVVAVAGAAWELGPEEESTRSTGVSLPVVP
jgi:L-seryl-tRNA(Ser) seleniumtransferase